MDVKVIKTDTNKNLLQNLFDNMSKKLTKDEMQQLVFTDSTKNLYSLVERYISPIYIEQRLSLPI